MNLSFTGSTQTFSSYPGLIVSLDDFYIVKSSNNSSLVITETTNDIFNTSLYANLSIQSVPYYLGLLWLIVMQPMVQLGYHCFPNITAVLIITVG